MEIERALFRIHQRTLSTSLTFRARRVVELVLPAVVVFLSLLLAWTHWEHVGQARCLPTVLGPEWNRTQQGSVVLPDDLQVNLAVLYPGADLAANASQAAVRYRFTSTKELLTLPKEIRANHSFQEVNITVTPECLSSSAFMQQAMIGFGAVDAIVVNELAYTFVCRGYLERLSMPGTPSEIWLWGKEDVSSTLGSKLSPTKIVWKVGLIFRSITVWGVTSCITGCFIRVAITCAAVLVFPFALLAHRCGVPFVPLHLLCQSYPWIGSQIDALRRNNAPTAPLLQALLIFLAIQSFSYVSCNLTWRLMVYRKSAPEGYEESLFSLVAGLELFSLVFMRTEGSIVVFPRAVSVALVALHFYVSVTLYPFAFLALWTTQAWCCYVGVYCLNHFEDVALRTNPHRPETPCMAHPRASYMPRFSSSWSLQGPPLWTMFYPVTFAWQWRPEALRWIGDEEYAML